MRSRLIGTSAGVRLVLDTNVVLSALLWHGTPHDLISAVVQQEGVVLFSSQHLIRELAGVPRRRKFSEILEVGNTTPEEVLHLYTGFARVVKTNPLSEPVAPDPDDDAVLACALAAKADLIVSGYNDLLVLKNYGSIPIVTVAEALQHVLASNV